MDETNRKSPEADRRESVMTRDEKDTIAAIRASHADIEAGRVMTVAEAFGKVRKQLERGSARG